MEKQSILNRFLSRSFNACFAIIFLFAMGCANINLKNNVNSDKRRYLLNENSADYQARLVLLNKKQFYIEIYGTWLGAFSLHGTYKTELDSIFFDFRECSDSLKLNSNKPRCIKANSVDGKDWVAEIRVENRPITSMYPNQYGILYYRYDEESDWNILNNSEGIVSSLPGIGDERIQFMLRSLNQTNATVNQRIFQSQFFEIDSINGSCLNFLGIDNFISCIDTISLNGVIQRKDSSLLNLNCSMSEFSGRYFGY